jgi:hypothetical protein|tara:strand:+ start:8622 stop:8867 length:246 start_codon:yes stop_codon:yes gene_type:complete
MATNDMEIILDVWDTMKSYIPAKEKMAAAERIIKLCDDNGIRKTDIAEMTDDDKILETAFDRYFIDDDEDDLDNDWDEYEG